MAGQPHLDRARAARIATQVTLVLQGGQLVGLTLEVLVSPTASPISRIEGG